MITSLKQLTKIIYSNVYYPKQISSSAIYAALKSYNGIDWLNLHFKPHINGGYSEAFLFSSDDRLNYSFYFNNETISNKTHKHSLIIKAISWDPKYIGEFHNHNNHQCYYKILKGSLSETIQNTKFKTPLRETVYDEHNIGFICDKTGEHKIKNIMDSSTYSIHIYYKNNTDNDSEMYWFN